MIQIVTENIIRRLLCILICLLGWLLLTIPVCAEENSVHARLATSSLLLDAQRVEQALVAVGEWGHVLISEDNGDNWHQATVPTQAILTGVHFVDRQHGWAVGHDQVILRTLDGGQR